MSYLDQVIQEHRLSEKTDEELAYIFEDAGAAWEAVRHHDATAANKYADICFAVSKVEGERHPYKTHATPIEAMAADGKL